MVKRITPELDALFRLVRARTKERGAVQRLADRLGVSHSTLSDWLRGRFEPGGEVTLALRKWVFAPEAPQTKTDPVRVSARTGQKTRKSKSKTNEKAKSDRPEG